ncbi:hypothetical protein [Kitasatospora aureofaciens]|uniref:hypothetical protein n=1 Tax=Kitasatospora aureofaciens TaxID=1894 RepID=UPI000ACFB573|nr:hypothetical protein [Kitasatospora aureofaciens]
MTDITRPDQASAAPGRLELAPHSSRPASVDRGRGRGRAILDSPLVRGSVWLRWSGHDGVRTLHHGAGFARGWTEKDVDGLDGWVALVEGRIVLGQGPDGQPEPVVHAEAWQAGATLHAARAQHPARPDHTQAEDQPDHQEHPLLGDVPHRVRRRAAGMTLENIQHALEQAQFEERCADRHADAGHETAYTTATTTLAEWQRIHDPPPPPAPNATTPTTTPPSSTRRAVNTTARTWPTGPAKPPSAPARAPTPPTAASPAPPPNPSALPRRPPAGRFGRPGRHCLNDVGQGHRTGPRCTSGAR